MHVDPATKLVGQAPSFLEVLRQVAKVASIDAPVLIAGETGTGKELVARAMHYSGPRRVHRRARIAIRADRPGPMRHFISRRSGCAAAAWADRIAEIFAGFSLLTARFRARSQCRCAHHRRHQRGSRSGRRAQTFPSRFIVSTENIFDHLARAPRAPGGSGTLGQALRPALQRAIPTRGAADRRVGSCLAPALFVAG